MNIPENSHQEDEHLNQWYDEKSTLMSRLLGKEHNIVMHSIIPFSVGGGLDLYYYPNEIQGVGIATKELSESPIDGSKNNQFDLYELVMFTKYELNLDLVNNEDTKFGKVHKSISKILNCIANYSKHATLNHNETCEFPIEIKDIGGKCLLFQAYKWSGKKQKFGILAIIEVFRSELEFARNNSTQELVEMLKKKGFFPYSDLDRPSVA